MFFLASATKARSRRRRQHHPMALLIKLAPPPPPTTQKSSAVTAATNRRSTSRSPSCIPSGFPETAAFTTDPASPKIGCMGQVNRPAGGSSPVSVRETLNSLVRAFNRVAGRGAGGARVRDGGYSTGAVTDAVVMRAVVDVDKMDPPLPVVPKLAPPVGLQVGRLWERRCGAAPLEGIKLQQPFHNLQAR